LWAKSGVGSDNDYGQSVATDGLGNVFVTGYFFSPLLNFGSSVLNNTGTCSAFLAKYDSSGNALWAKSGGGTSDVVSYSVCSDASNNAYITGWSADLSIHFGNTTLISAGGADAFFVKYDSSGNLIWAKNIGGALDEFGFSVATDKFGKVYVTGSLTSPTILIDTITLPYPSSANLPIYIAEFDSSGHALFALGLASDGDDNYAITTGPSGCMYIGGDFYSINPLIIGNDSLYRSGIEEVFVAKLCNHDIIESVTEIGSTKEFILYPNPFDDKLTASPRTASGGRGDKQEFELTLFDVFGRVLLRRSFINQATINTQQIASGIYFYEVKNKDSVGARGKLVKQ